ncbi:hypothetical protein A6P39_005120 [Streptomyces sp. FXJ1.172]|uniref:hypothetical protein n=1 Tax=Streptomyces sp. FXJ1.172 TaxID=710705 RepID=UPI001331AEA3|nr:hypothetical protein [Streptomyces sp. FXJ1.172]WEO93450.1 hypothetical protein A6P39_005120 [Streptomyces sp. FXJ1.172]
MTRLRDATPARLGRVCEATAPHLKAAAAMTSEGARLSYAPGQRHRRLARVQLDIA